MRRVWCVHVNSVQFTCNPVTKCKPYFLINYFYLKGSHTHTHTKIQRSPIHWFSPQMPATAKDGSAQSQWPANESRSPNWVAETPVLEPSFATSQGAPEQEAKIGITARS